jgi:hypothetical protein
VLLSPFTLAENTDINRRSFPPPQEGHFKPFPLLPTGHRRSVTTLHFSHLNSYNGIPRLL